MQILFKNHITKACNIGLGLLSSCEMSKYEQKHTNIQNENCKALHTSISCSILITVQCIASVIYPSTRTTQRWFRWMAFLNDGLSIIPSQRQLFRRVGNWPDSPRCQLGTRPHFITCRTRFPISSPAAHVVPDV